MNTTKRFISFIIALAIGMACGGVFAEDSEQSAQSVTETQISKKEAAENEANALLSAILKRDARPATRAGFISDAATLAGLSFGKEGAMYYDDLQPTSPEAAAICAAADAGIISKGGLFRPDDAVTAEEAAKVLTVMLGYERYAQISGGWTKGYIAAADKAELFENVSSRSGALTDADAHIMLLNMLNSRMVYLSGENDYEAGEKTMLEKIWKTSRIYGIVADTEYGETITIDETSYTYEDDCSEYMGSSVYAYVSDDGELVALSKSSKNEYTSFSIYDTEMTDSLTVSVDGEKREYKYKLSDGYRVLYNGKMSDKPLTRFTDGKDGKITLVDNNGDNRYDMAVVELPTYITVSSVSKSGKSFYDANDPENYIDLSNSECKYYIYGRNGEIRLLDMKAGETYEVYVSEDKMLVKANMVKTTTSGTVTALGEDGATIGKVTYDTTDYFDKYYKKQLKVGAEGAFAISSDGRLVNFTSYSNVMRYGYISYANKDSDDDDKIILKIFSEDGERRLYTMQGRVKKDGQMINADKIYPLLRPDSNTLNDQLVRFNSNDADEITAIDFAEVETSELNKKKQADDMLTEYKFDVSSFYFKDSVNLMYPSFNVSSSKVFVIPFDLNDDDIYRYTNYSYFTDARSYSGLMVYDVDEAGTAGAVVVRTDTITRGLSKYVNSFVVESVTQAKNDNDEILYKIYGWIDNKYQSYFVDKSISLVKASGETIGFGDVLRFNTENDVIKTLVCDFDANENVFARNNASDVGYFNEGNRDVVYQFGRAYSINGGYIYIGGGENGDDMSVGKLRNFKTDTNYISIIDMNDKSIKTGTLSDIKTYKNAGKGDLVMIRQRNLFTAGIMVYLK